MNLNQLSLGCADRHVVFSRAAVKTMQIIRATLLSLALAGSVAMLIPTKTAIESVFETLRFNSALKAGGNREACTRAPVGTQAPRYNNLARQIARDAALAGKNQPGECLVFAKGLEQKLKSANIPCQIVVFHLSNAEFAHAIVVYRERNRWYGQDNQNWLPKWLNGNTPEEWASSFCEGGFVDGAHVYSK